MHNFKFILCSILLCLTQTAAAQMTANKTAPNAVFKMTYGSTSWNRESGKIDQAFIFIREKTSGKIAKILLEESEPDSSIFSGPFSLDWKTAKSSDIEIFIVEENFRYSEAALAQVKPSPIFLRMQNGIRVVDIYDTPAQAKNAQDLYEKQKQDLKQSEKTKNLKPVPGPQALAAAALAEKEKLMKKLAQEAAERQNMRLRLEQLEAQRLAQIKKQQNELSASEKQQRLTAAAEWSAKGRAAYQQGDFKNAEIAFGKSLELDPNDRSNHFMYGVSLYRNDKFNEALVALKLSPPNRDNELEKKYYTGLIHYRLKEFVPAQAQFKVIQKSNDKNLAPSAAFYSGLIYFSAENFDAAKAAFEWVLDQSQDPALDKKAEEYIEQIAAMLEIKKIASQKWNIKAAIGAGYDSNILFSPDGEASQGLATDDGGLRMSLSGDVDYRIFYRQNSELNAKVSSYYMYSLDSKFASADPFTINASLPYVRKGVMSGKGYKLQLSPGYEKLYLDANDTGTRDNILNSIIANSELTLIMRENWFASYTVEVRQEDSFLESAAADNLDATKLNLKTQHIFLLDSSKKRALVGLGGYTLADAEGENRKFNRIDLGVIYSTPTKRWSNTSLTYGITLYTLDYNKSSDNRKDNNVTLLAGLNRPLNAKWTLGINGNYSNNASTVDDYQYSKYTAMTTFTYNWVK